jgi:hypothetical protein
MRKNPMANNSAALGAAAAILLLACSARAAEKEAAPEPVGVSVDKVEKDYALLEPVIVQLVFRNNTDKDVDIARPGVGETVRIEVEYQGAKMHYGGEGAPRRSGPIPTDRVPAGKRRYIQINLLECFAIRRPGEYSVTVTYDATRKNLKEAALTDQPVAVAFKFKVRSPTQEESKAIHRAFGVDGLMFPSALQIF